MHLFLEALDVWLFRDGRPFDAFSDHRAESVFPPYPSVMQGAIRSHHLVVKGVDLRDGKQIEATVGTVDDYKTLRMRGPFLARKENGQIVRYLPVPAHAVPGKDGYVTLSPTQLPATVKTSAPTAMLLVSNEEPQKKEFGQWLRENQVLQLLKQETKAPIVGKSETKFFARESRLGIARNDARRTDEGGALYEVEFIRPCKNVGLLLEVNGYDGWPQTGVMRIGGEGRAARFEQVSNLSIPSPSMGEGKGEGEKTNSRTDSSSVSPWPSPPDPLPQRFLIYFATPTYFVNGWLPESWEKFFDGEVTLQSAALNRFQSLGGFDLAANNHKPSRRYIPAGAVYFFEARGEAALKSGLTQNAVTDLGAEIGFGQVLVERW
ncbi:MAG: type III-B CRISPR module-associated Cmr3 family protein [Candidatus Binatia bacterium]